MFPIEDLKSKGSAQIKLNERESKVFHVRFFYINL